MPWNSILSWYIISSCIILIIYNILLRISLYFVKEQMIFDVQVTVHRDKFL